MSRILKVMIVAGEPSGDIHAAKLVREIKALDIAGEYEFFGVAGPAMRDAGVDPVVNADNLSIVGLPEIGKALPMFLNAFRDLKSAAIIRNPDVVVLVDFPDFNLKLAKSLKKKGFKIVYYISPQLWAWRKYRIRTVRKYVDLVITILPFEKDWYANEGISHVEYVGNPLAMEVHSHTPKAEFCAKHRIDLAKPIVSLLPGSRHKEIVRILPVMLETAAAMTEKNCDIQFLIALAETRHEVDAAEGFKRFHGGQLPTNLKLIIGETHDVLNASDAAAITSGTATLEATIIGTPMAIVYKTSPLNYKLLRPLISVEHFGLVNLIAGERIVKELIQNDFTAGTLADELNRLLEPAANTLMREKLKETTDKLGHGGASKRAAQAILKLLQLV